MSAARRLLFPLVLVALFVAAWPTASAQAPRAATNPATAALGDTIPVDPRITTGRFSNGLRYYIRANKKPEGRAELRLAVNAGSVLEDDDQRGLAHFVEHMAFNGTANFPKQEIVNFVQSIGMRFGNDLNASTGFDETVYMLQVPTDRLPVVDRAMLILSDWAQRVTFDPVEIDKERGVVLEEWRLGLGAQGRLRDKQFPVLLEGSRYADRLPIGTPESLRTFSHDRLRQFYRDWYRPDLMAVVAVGDFNVADIEALVRKHFGDIPAARNPRPRPAFTMPDHPGTRYSIATDPELGSTSVSVYHTMPARDQTTIAAYREQQVVERLFTGMLNARFAEEGLKPGAPFLGAGANIGGFVRTVAATTLAAAVRDTGVEQGLDALFTEAARVAKFGFTATEFERQKTTMLRNLERAMAEFDNQQSGSLAAEYIRNFTTDEPIPGLAYEYELYKRFLPQISLDEMNALARTWAPDRNRVVVVSAPAKAAAALPTPARLGAIMAAAGGKALTPYADTVSAQPLVATAPRPGAVTATTTRPELGITEWTLSNGIKVVLKPTTFRQDEVLMRAFRPGGTSLAPDGDFIPAQTAGQVVGSGGLGTFGPVELQRVLTGKVAAAGASIGEYFEEVSGNASPKDLEAMFQLVYLRFTQPRADPSIFSVLTDRTRVALANQRNSPEFAFNEALTQAIWQGHPRATLMTEADLGRMDLQKSLSFYKERFSDASGFTFVFVGSFEPAALRPLVERYLASLPSTGRANSWRDVGLRRATGVVDRTVRKGTEPKSQTAILFSGPFEYDQTHRTVLRAMAMALEGSLRNALREDLGGTYSVGVSASSTKVPTPTYTLGINFGSDPARTDALIRTVFAEIDALKTNGPDERDVRNIREILTRDFESSSKQNGFLLREIALRYQNGENIGELFSLPKYVDAISGPAIQEAARRYFDTNNVTTVKLVPER